VKFYVSIFKDSKILGITRYEGESAVAASKPAGSVMTVAFQLQGQEFTALNGGPAFSFSQAVSFVINCKTQKEVDRYWDKLSEGGEKQPCGWVKDKYGLSWQVVPGILSKLLQGKDKVKSKRVYDAMLKMTKLDIETLKAA
jgi:predicted 3-demethylubiquinone-9 3-methyltransferase (glyoxalase superfamily)